MQPSLQQSLEAYIMDSENPERNWDMALQYEHIGHTAAAIGYYIRTAERTTDTLLQYECMVRSALCFESQGIRKFSVKGMLQHAVALLPERPEAYYYLSIFQSNEKMDGNWFESYVSASQGYFMTQQATDLPVLRTDVGYEGSDVLLFQKAHAGWWCGLCDESRDIFREMYARTDLSERLHTLVKMNLIRLNGFNTIQLEPYKYEYHQQFIAPFPGLETIDINHSESFQDMFVLAALKGKRNGTYLEIGSCQPFYGNNTALLERLFDWKGVSLDIDEHFVEMFNQSRSNPCLLRDGTKVDYEKFLKGLGYSEQMDYLQIDCDPPSVTYQVLLTIPFESIKFGVITFEHDDFADEEKKYKALSREYLKSYGYVCLAGDIAPDEHRSYEDWWVHPDLIDADVIKKLTSNYIGTKKAKDYMLGKYKT